MHGSARASVEPAGQASSGSHRTHVALLLACKAAENVPSPQSVRTPESGQKEPAGQAEQNVEFGSL